MSPTSSFSLQNPKPVFERYGIREKACERVENVPSECRYQSPNSANCKSLPTVPDQCDVWANWFRCIAPRQYIAASPLLPGSHYPYLEKGVSEVEGEISRLFIHEEWPPEGSRKQRWKRALEELNRAILQEASSLVPRTSDDVMFQGLLRRNQELYDQVTKWM